MCATKAVEVMDVGHPMGTMQVDPSNNSVLLLSQGSGGERRGKRLRLFSQSKIVM